MAVEDKYVDTNAAANDLVPAPQDGAETISMVKTFEVAAADDDGSVYRVFKGVPGDLVPFDIKVTNDAITSGDDYDFGIYEADLGAVKDKDALADGIDMSSARVEGAGASLLVTVGQSDAEKKIFELAGDSATSRKQAYDLALTANTVGSAAGTITVKATFIKP